MMLFTGFAPIQIFYWLIQTAQGFPRDCRAEFIGLRLGDAMLTVYPDRQHPVAYDVVIRDESINGHGRAVKLEGYARADLFKHLITVPCVLKKGTGLDVPTVYSCPITVAGFRLWPWHQYAWDQPFSVLVKSFTNGHLGV